MPPHSPAAECGRGDMGQLKWLGGDVEIQQGSGLALLSLEAGLGRGGGCRGGLGSSGDCFSLLVGVRPEQGMSFFALSPKKQGVFTSPSFQTERDTQCTAGEGWAAAQHCGYFHHTASMDVNNLKSIHNSKM